jgi:hypothetical protein
LISILFIVKALLPGSTAIGRRSAALRVAHAATSQVAAARVSAATQPAHHALGGSAEKTS